MKKIIAVVVMVCLAALFLPTVSHAAITPFFIAVNDTLLPFNSETMPYVTRGEYFVPHSVFSGASVWSIASTEHVRVYTGASRYVDFYTSSGTAEDQDGNVLSWPSARRVSGRIYVPLRQVCEFFGLTYDILAVSREIIPQEQMYVIRIRSTAGFSGLNVQTFFGLHRTALRNAYNDYFAQPSPSPSPGSEPPESPMPPEPPPRYNDVTIHHSFYGISAGGVTAILELLEQSNGIDKRFCFFVSAEDIRADAGIIRRLSADGYTIGIWLVDGTFDEYQRTSALLFEATKIKTVIVSSGIGTEPETAVMNDNSIIFWDTAQSIAYDDTFSVDAVTDLLPQESGGRRNLISSCSEFTALMLADILSYLQEYEYIIAGITETTLPV